MLSLCGKQIAKTVPELDSSKIALGSHTGAPWGARGAQNASMLKEKHQIGDSTPPNRRPFGGNILRESGKEPFVFLHFLRPSLGSLVTTSAHVGCVF